MRARRRVKVSYPIVVYPSATDEQSRSTQAMLDSSYTHVQFPMLAAEMSSAIENCIGETEEPLVAWMYNSRS
jgi:hypothetical protein